MAKSHKYYLTIDEEIVDFSLWPEFPDMTDFLLLSLFTQMFNDKKSLMDALIKIGFVKIYSVNPNISIVKKTSRGYIRVSDRILFKRDAKFLNSNNVVDFLYKNKNNFMALSDLFQSYLNEIDELIAIFEKKLEYLNADLKASKGDERIRILKDIESRNNSLRNFNLDRATISNIFDLFSMMRGGYDVQDDIEIEYMGLVQRFVTYETMYIKGTKVSPNYRGMVKLATKIGDISQKYGISIVSFEDSSFPQKKYMIFKSYLAALVNRVNQEEVFTPSPIRVNSENDPDEFMFLEPSDFDRMIKSDSSNEFKCSVEADKEAFTEKRIGLETL